MIGSEFFKIKNFYENFQFGRDRLTDKESDLEICFVEHILDAMTERARAGFLCVLGIQSLISSVFSLSVILELKRLVYFVFSSIISSQLLLPLQ